MRFPRFRIRTLMGLPVLAGMALFLLDSCREEYYLGHITVPLDFRVIDDVSGAAIPAATVELFRPEATAATLIAATDLDGRATLPANGWAGGTSSLLRRTRFIEYIYDLRAKAPCYEAYENDLPELTADPRFRSNVNPPMIVIRLRKR